MSKKKKQKFPKEYKLAAVKLVTDQSYTYAEAGRSLGIAGNLISRWHKEFQAATASMHRINTDEFYENRVTYLR